MKNELSKEEILSLIKKDNNFFNNHPEYHDDYDIVMDVVYRSPEKYNHISERLKANKDVLLTVLSRLPWAKNILEEKYIDDEALLMEVSKRNPVFALGNASKRLQDNYAFVKKMVVLDGRGLSKTTERLQDNKNIVLLAVASSEYAINHASARLQKWLDEQYIKYKLDSLDKTAQAILKERAELSELKFLSRNKSQKPFKKAKI